MRSGELDRGEVASCCLAQGERDVTVLRPISRDPRPRGGSVSDCTLLFQADFQLASKRILFLWLRLLKFGPLGAVVKVDFGAFEIVKFGTFFKVNFESSLK